VVRNGGIRLAAPLSPAIHLGASRVIDLDALRPLARPKPIAPSSPVTTASTQVLGVLYNAIFLDLI
jgi:NTE family protein